MKRICIILLLCCMLFGCDDETQMEKVMSVRERISNGCNFRCSIVADYIDRVKKFQLDCNVDSSGNVEFTVCSPESISGICGRIDGNGGTLTYDSYVLLFPLLADGALSPISVPWIVVEALRGGYIRSTGADAEFVRLTVDDTYGQQTLQVDVWLTDDLKIDRCEVIWEGRRILSMNVEMFAWL